MISIYEKKQRKEGEKGRRRKERKWEYRVKLSKIVNSSICSLHFYYNGVNL